MPCIEYSSAHRAQLLDIARSSLTHAVETGQSWTVDTGRLPAALRHVRCTFVTLRRAGELRGCTGSLTPSKPLAVDVAESACQTALADPRFLPVKADEIDAINIEISVLSPLNELFVQGAADLSTQLRPGIDGLLLAAGPRRATFLPKVWESLPDPRQFVAELKKKAGLKPDFWSDDIQVFRYQTDTFSEADAGS